MHVSQAFGILLLGAGLGTFLTWLQQTAVRRRFQQELESQIDQALFDELRRRKLASHAENAFKRSNLLFWATRNRVTPPITNFSPTNGPLGASVARNSNTQVTPPCGLRASINSTPTPRQRSVR